MKKVLTFALAISIFSLGYSDAEWRSILAAPTLRGPSADDIKVAAATHLSLTYWLQESLQLERGEAESLAYDALGAKPIAEVKRIGDTVKLLQEEQQMLKVVEARRDLFTMTVLKSRDGTKAIEAIIVDEGLERSVARWQKASETIKEKKEN